MHIRVYAYSPRETANRIPFSNPINSFYAVEAQIDFDKSIEIPVLPVLPLKLALSRIE